MRGEEVKSPKTWQFPGQRGSVKGNWKKKQKPPLSESEETQVSELGGQDPENSQSGIYSPEYVC